MNENGRDALVRVARALVKDEANRSENYGDGSGGKADNPLE